MSCSECSRCSGELLKLLMQLRRVHNHSQAHFFAAITVTMPRVDFNKTMQSRNPAFRYIGYANYATQRCVGTISPFICQKVACGPCSFPYGSPKIGHYTMSNL